MKIAGLIKSSLINYPGKISCVIFTYGCNFQCPFCHNSELIGLKKYTSTLLDENYIFDFLKSRKGQLEGVVITGGEPTVHWGLVIFMGKIKKLGYLIKLDTNGSQPEMLNWILKYPPLQYQTVDYIAMDIKAPLDRYHIMTGCSVDTERIKKSIDIIKKSGIDHEFRTTMVKPYLTFQDTVIIKEMIGDSKYVLQRGVCGEKVLNPGFFWDGEYLEAEIETFRQRINNEV